MKFYDFTVKDKKGNDVSLKEYEGKLILVVNTATKCGLTPQYEALQNLYDKYATQGFVILDFPCNQFLEQAPGSIDEIHEFCSLNFGTKFPRFSKIDVNGENEAPLYKWLKAEAPVDKGNEDTAKFEALVKEYTPNNNETDIKWNFGKFIIGRDGRVIDRYSPAMPPEVLEDLIKSML
ncbi:MAG: glutathione peroxidase [Anaerotignum sp.]